MTNTKHTTVHHANHLYGSGVETIDFEISAHKRYDERKKPLKRRKYGDRQHSDRFVPLKEKGKKSRIEKESDK